ncbi:MAG TPA: hypothetical protein VHB48_13740 [Chitinophagaceae bacterium]|nr:hypothetical protein [Chitinophagaceae bacterium]
MIEFFEFVFYKVYKQYTSWGERDVPGVYALGVITLFPFMNILSFLFFIFSLLHIKSYDSGKPIVFIAFLVVFGLNYYRVYKIVTIDKLLEKWSKVERRKEKRLGTLMFVYLILSILFMGLSLVR